MTVDSILSWAKTETKTLKPLAPSAPRTLPAKITEVLARKALTLPHKSKKRKCYTDALLQHLTPLMRQTFFGSAAVNRRTLESEDFVQDASIKTITLLNRYFDPKKGPFISVAVMTFRQTVSNMNKKQAGLEQKECFINENSHALDKPIREKEKVQGTITAWLKEFITWLSESENPAWQELARVAHVYWWYLTRFNEMPEHSVIAQHLDISTQRFTGLRDKLLLMFKDYIHTYKEAIAIEAL